MKNLFRGIVMDVLQCKLWDIVLEEVGQTRLKNSFTNSISITTA